MRARPFVPSRGSVAPPMDTVSSALDGRQPCCGITGDSPAVVSLETGSRRYVERNGGSGIRTHEASRPPAFQAGTFVHSAIPPTVTSGTGRVGRAVSSSVAGDDRCRSDVQHGRPLRRPTRRPYPSVCGPPPVCASCASPQPPASTTPNSFRQFSSSSLSGSWSRSCWKSDGGTSVLTRSTMIWA